MRKFTLKTPPSHRYYCALFICAMLVTSPYAQPIPRAEAVEEAPPTRAKPVPEDGAPPVNPPLTPPPAPPPPRPAQPATPPSTPAVPRTAEDELFEFANAIYEKKSWDAAVTRYAKYIESYPKGKHLDAVLFRQGECNAQMGRLEAAENCYRQVVKRGNPGKFTGYSAFRLATFAYNRGKDDPKYYAEAAPLFAMAARNAIKNEEKVQYYYFEGLSYLSIDKKQEAQKAFAALLKIESKIAGNLYVEKATLGLARMDLDASRKEEAKVKFTALGQDASSNLTKAESLVSAGMIDLDAGKHEAAIEVFEQAKSLTSADKWPSMAGYGLIRCYYHSENWKKIPPAWTGVDLNHIPEMHRAQILLIVGHAYRHLDQFNPAITHYGMVEQFFPESIEAMEAGYRKLYCFYKLGDPRTNDSAQAFIEKQREKHPESEYIDMAALMSAEDNFNKKEYKEAAKAYRFIRLEKLPEKNRSGTIYRRGWAEYEAKDYAASVESLTYFIDKFPTDPAVSQALFKRGLAYLQVKDLANCQKDLEMVVTKYSDSREAEMAIRQLGLVKGERKDYAGMVATFEELLKKFPQTKYIGESHFWIGTGLYAQQLWKECIPALEKALLLYVAEKEDISNKLINAYASLQDLPKLAGLVDDYYKTPPTMKVRTDVLCWLGHQKFTQKDYAGAAKYLAFAIANDDAKSQKPYIWLCLAESQVETKDWQGAINSADFFLANAPEDTPAERKAKASFFKGCGASGLKQYSTARKLFQTTLDTAPEGKLSALSRIELGKIAFWEEDYSESASLFSVPALYFEDPEITPVAIEWEIAALKKLGKTSESEKFQQDLKEKYPAYWEKVENGESNVKSP